MQKTTTFLGVLILALTAHAADPAAPAATEMETPAVAGTVELLSSGVGASVENRELMGESDQFASPGPVAFLTKVKASATPTTVKHIWSVDGKVVSEVTLNVNGNPWRTFSRKTVWPGAWKAEVADESGAVLGAKEFTVTAEPAEAPGGALAPVPAAGQ